MLRFGTGRKDDNNGHGESSRRRNERHRKGRGSRNSPSYDLFHVAEPAASSTCVVPDREWYANSATDSTSSIPHRGIHHDGGDDIVPHISNEQAGYCRWRIVGNCHESRHEELNDFTNELSSIRTMLWPLAKRREAPKKSMILSTVCPAVRRPTTRRFQPPVLTLLTWKGWSKSPPRRIAFIQDISAPAAIL